MNAPPPGWLTKEKVEEHVTGVILASHFSLKKGIELLGNRAEKATTKQLQQIHVMDNYELQDALKLSKKEKRDAI